MHTAQDRGQTWRQHVPALAGGRSVGGRPPPARLRCALWLGLWVGATGAAQAQYVLTPFSVAGYTDTIVWDIDSRGNLAGFVNDDLGSHGFVRVDGQVELITGPTGAVSSAVRGRADTGLVVGTWTDSSAVRRGFVRENDQTSSFTVPFAGAQDIDSWALSPNGRWLLGLWTSSAAGATQAPFLWDRQTNQFTALPAPGNGLVRDVNDQGQVIASLGSGTVLYSATDPAAGWRTLPANPGARTFLDSERLAGVATFGGVRQAWIGPIGAPQAVLPLPTDASYEMRVGNAAGELVLRAAIPTDTGLRFAHLVATPVVLPVAGDGPGRFRFDLPVRAGVPVFLDPEVAVGYRYSIGDGDPLFASVRLPDGIGDGHYDLLVGGQSFAALAGQVVEFAALGFGAGVASFEVQGIEPEAQLDPANPQAFVTRVTFKADGRFTGTQVALTTTYPPVPEPATVWLWLVGLVGLGWGARWRRNV